MCSGDDTNLDIANCKGTVHLIVTKLETGFKRFNISEIIKGGSLGHGTAVPCHYDIDLVIYSRDIKPEDVYAQKGFKKWVDLLKSFIERELNVRCTYTPGYNHRSVTFSIVHRDVCLKVDLLVSPYWDTPHDFYRFLRQIPKEGRDMFTVCASKWQVDFFENRENQVKEYIKRAKAWRNRVWNDSSPGRPSSYLLSLLVVKAYEKSVHSGAHEVTRALRTLVKSSTMDVYWADGPNDNYRRADYPNLLPSRPRIIDPANPANNVWKSGFKPYGNSSVLVSKIDTIDLSKPIN